MNARTKLTTNELAHLMRLHPRTVRRYARTGCPHYRDGERYLFNPARVRCWMAARGFTGTPGRPLGGGREKRWNWAEIAAASSLMESATGKSIAEQAREALAFTQEL